MRSTVFWRVYFWCVLSEQWRITGQSTMCSRRAHIAMSPMEIQRCCLIMAHNDVFSSPDLIFTHRGRCRVKPRTHLLHIFPRGRYPPEIYLSCQWFFHDFFSSRAIVRVSVSYGLFPVLLPRTLFQSFYSFSPIGHLHRGQFFVSLLLATAVVAAAVTFIIVLSCLLSRFV